MLKDYVCVEVLKEKEKPFFSTYDVEVMPTMLVLTPAGVEVGRFMGFHPPEQFIEKFIECASADKNLKKAGELLSKDPGNAEGLWLNAIGNLYKRDKLKVVFDNLDKLTGKTPTKMNKTFICRGLLELYELEKNRTGRKTADTKALIEEKNRHIKRIAEIDPENETGLLVDALYLLGLSEIKKPEEMKKYFDRLKKFDPEDKSGYADDMAFAEAMAPIYAKKFKTAAGALEKFVENHGTSRLLPKALFQIARCWYYAKEKEKAIQVLEKLLKEYPRANEAKSARSLLKRLKK